MRARATIDFEAALEAACGDLMFLVKFSHMIEMNSKTLIIMADMQDEVVDLYFSFLSSSLIILKNELRDCSCEAAEARLEDLYCSSFVLGFNTIASKALTLRTMVHLKPGNTIAAQSEFFFLKCEAQLVWTEWYYRRSLINLKFDVIS